MRILLVEDEVKLANAIKRALELQSYAVDAVYTGNEGLDLALSEEFDLLILDIMLPEVDGITIAKTVRQEKITTPILMLTAKGQVTDKVVGLDVGADDYMVKPFSFEELFARIRALTRRPQQIQDSILTIQNLVLNRTAFTVTCNNTLIHVSAKEFAMLEYLVQNRNTVLSKDQIVSHVWNYEANILPNTVEVHIKHLRDKLHEKCKTPLITTVRGRGYVIRDKE